MIMASQTKAPKQATNAHRPDDDVSELAAQTEAAVRSISSQVQGSMIDTVRQGQDSSLKALQAWADMGRQCSSPTFGATDGARLIGAAFDVLETMLAAQRRFVDQLIANQRAFAGHLLDVAEAQGRTGTDAPR